MGVEEPLLVIEEGVCIKEKVDELEETLSLSDLPLHSDQSADWDQDFSLTSNSTSSSSSHDQDYFEFFSQQPNTSAAGLPPENIVFCGKLIPYRQLTPCKPDDEAEMKKIHHTWRLKISSTINAQVPKNENKSTTTLQHKKMYNTNKLGKGHGFPTRRVSVFAAPRRKAKWYFFLFGISRFSPVVELTDIRSRKSGRSCRPPPSSQPPMCGFRSRDGKAISDRRWGFWGLIRALSCGGNH